MYEFPKAWAVYISDTKDCDPIMAAIDAYLPMQKHIAQTSPPMAMMIPKIITVT